MRHLPHLSGLVMCLGLFACPAYSQQHDHAPGAEMSGHLADDLEEIRNTRDPAERKRLMQHHFQMMQEHIQGLRDGLAEFSQMGMMGQGGGMGGMDHGAGGGQGMGGMDQGEGQGMGGMDHGSGNRQGRGDMGIGTPIEEGEAEAMAGGHGGMDMSHHTRMVEHQQQIVDMLDHLLGMQEIMLEMVGD